MKKLFLLLTACCLLLALVACTQIVEYRVQQGDTLISIAKKYGTTTTEIINLNASTYPELKKDPLALRAGWVLQIKTNTELGEAFAVLAERAYNELQNANKTPTLPVNPNVNTTDEKLLIANALVWQGINLARTNARLRDLALDTTLTRIAIARCEDLIQRHYFSHNDPVTGRVMFEELLKANRYSYQFAGENIAEIKNEGTFVPSALTVLQRYTAQRLADQFVTGWLTSPEHRENIMNGKFRRTGIIIAASGDGTRIVAAQVFSD